MAYGESHPKSKRKVILDTIEEIARSDEVITTKLVAGIAEANRETTRSYLSALEQQGVLVRCNGGYTCSCPQEVQNFKGPLRPRITVKNLLVESYEITDLPPISKTMEDLLAYIKELEDRVIFLEKENKGLYQQFSAVHQQLANCAYNPRVILPAMPDHS
jgi:hypothetical protein